MAENVGGLLSNLFKGTPLAGMNVQPQLKQNEITLEFNTDQFKQAILSAPGSTLNPAAASAIQIEFHEGKMIIRIRLV